MATTARPSFTTARKGFDQSEVGAYLDRVEAELRDLRAQGEEQRQRNTALETELASVKERLEAKPAAPAAGELDETAIAAAVGEEMASVIRTARAVAEDLRAKATADSERILGTARTDADDIMRRARTEAEEAVTGARAEATQSLESARAEAARTIEQAKEEADRLLQVARTEAERTRDEATQLYAARIEEANRKMGEATADAERHAAEIRAKATVEVEAILAKASAEAASMRSEADCERRVSLEQAEAARERILSDLARRRRVATVQIEQLRAGRERLLVSYSIVRRTLEEVSEEFRRADAEARAAAEEVGRRLAAEIGPDGRLDDLPGDFATEDAAAAMGTAGTGTPAATGTEGTPAGTGAPDGTPGGQDGGTPPEGEAGPEGGPSDGGGGTPPPAGAPAGPSAGAGAGEPEGGAGGLRADHGVSLAGDGPALPDGGLFPGLGRLPGAPSGDDWQSSPVQPRPAIRVVRPDDDPASASVDDDDLVIDLRSLPALWAGGAPAEQQIGGEARGGVAVLVADGEVPADAVTGLFERIRAGRARDVREARRTLDATAADGGAPPVPAGELLARRDGALALPARELTRRLKRELQDEQSELLDRLRSAGASEASALLGSAGEQRMRFATAAAAFLVQAGGLGAAAAAAVPGADGDALPDMGGSSGQLADALVSPLRRRVEALLGDLGDADDREALVEAIGAAYRDTKTHRVERLAVDHLCAAYGLGWWHAVPEGTPLRWVAADAGGACADCDDDTLADPVAKGSPFPTGQLLPPVHEGCRCLLAPAGTPAS